MLSGTCRRVPSSGGSLKSGGFTGYAHAGGPSSLWAGVPAASADANDSIRSAANDFIGSAILGIMVRIQQPALAAAIRSTNSLRVNRPSHRAQPSASPFLVTVKTDSRRGG